MAARRRYQPRPCPWQNSYAQRVVLAADPRARKEGCTQSWPALNRREGASKQEQASKKERKRACREQGAALSLPALSRLGCTCIATSLRVSARWLAGWPCFMFRCTYQTFCNISITPEPWPPPYVIVIDTPTVIVFPLPDATHDTPLVSCREGEGEGEGEGNEGGQAGNECPDRHHHDRTCSSNIRHTTRSSTNLQ